MNMKQRLINLAKRRDPDTEGLSDSEIWQRILQGRISKMEGFKKGFKKTASPILSEVSYSGDAPTRQEQAQSILEASYADDKEPQIHTKTQKRNKTVTEQGPTADRSPNSRYYMPRS